MRQAGSQKRKVYRLKDGKRLLSVVLIFVAALVFLCTLARTVVNAQTAAEPLRVIVQPGDSLWSIADAHNHDGQVDIRQYIYQIKEVNNLSTSSLEPGQVLIIPAK